MIEIYHNPRCSKSRETLQLLEENGVEAKVIEYLKTVPTKAEIEAIIKKLGIKAEQLVRKTEPIYAELYKGRKLTSKQWIAAMAKHPKLIQRPIVVNGNEARIGRPPELVLEITK